MASLNDNSGLLRDPKTGRVLSEFASTAKRAQFAAAAHGMSDREQQVLAMEMSASDDSQGVQNYVQPMIHLVRQYASSAADLPKALPLITEIARRAETDITLSDAERRRVSETAKHLTSFVNEKRSLFSRIESQLKEVAKARAGKAREHVSEELQKSPSFLFKVAGKALARRERKESNFERDYLSARSDTYKSLVGRSAAPAPKPVKTPKLEKPEPEEAPAPVKSEGKKVTTKAPSKTGKGDNTYQVLGTILTVDRETLTEVKRTNTLLKSANDLEKRKVEAAAREDHDLPKTEVAKEVTKEKTPNKSVLGSLFSGVKDWLANLTSTFGESGLMGLVGKTLMPALKVLGIGAAAIGAAWAGWEVGSWISQLVGLGKSSDALAKLLDTKSQSISSSLSSIGNTISSLAFTGQTPVQNETAAAKKDVISRALGNGMMTSLQYHEGWANDELYKQAVEYNNQRARQKNIELSAQKTPLDSSRYPETGALVGANLNSRKIGAEVGTVPGGQGIGAVDLTPPSSVEKAGAQHVSESGIAALKQREGVRKTPYWDVNGWAIGYGDHTYKGQPLGADQNTVPPVKLSDAEASEMLRKRLQEHYEPIIRRALGGKGVSQSQFDALVSVAYNSEAAGRNLARRLAAGENLSIGDFQASGTVGGKRNAHLQARRAAEFDQYTSDSRNAVPIAALAAADRGKPPAPVVVQTNVSNGGSGGSVPIIPIPMVTENPDASVRGIRSVNAL